MTVPSSSAKQRRFMQAIAHSPSFAKKAGVPQSVGKDFAAADKTFKKGGEVKESKAMVEKEVAFMKKKGAPKSMIKHEEAEGMKKGGSAKYMSFTDKGKPAGMKPVQKVRRMADGGDVDMSMGSGDPFAKPRNYEAEKEQGARTLKGIKSFLGFGDKEEPVEEVKSSPVRATRSSAAAPSVSPAATSRVTTPAIVKKPESDEDKPHGPQFANSVSDRGEGEYSGDGLSPVKKPVIKRKPVGMEKIVKKERVITEPVDTSYSALESRRAPKKSEETKLESKSASKFGLASDETRESIRKGLGSVLNFLDLSKAHEREFGKKMAKGGDVKKMAQGGYAKADGIASRGKTQPKMVKMAGGGFVKSADGCAQRGKTRASQVKMSRGGKC